MNDTLVLALVGFATVVVTAVPATIAALNSRQARDHAREVQETVGEKNGNGPLMAMAARALGQNMELLAGQQKTAEIESELLDLHDYAQQQIHRLNGQVGILWAEFAKKHGLNPDVLPPPQPSPKQENQ